MIQYLKEEREERDLVEWGREFHKRESEGTKEWKEAEVREKGTMRFRGWNVQEGLDGEGVCTKTDGNFQYHNYHINLIMQ